MTKIAIVHDYLTQRGGAERVVLSMLKAFPDADLFTSVLDPENTFEAFGERYVHTLPLNRVGAIRRNHRLGLPLYATTFSRLEIDADVLIASSSGWAHATRTSGRKIVYCYNPARWLYQPAEYLSESGAAMRRMITASSPALRRWDQRAAQGADQYCATSASVAQRIREIYGITAMLVPPPPAITPDGPMIRPDLAEGPFFLCASRLLGYKNIDALIAAFASTPDLRLVIVGAGPDRARLSSLVTHNVTLLGKVSDPELRWLYEHCTALVSASFEDFGLTPLEAATFGRPSVVIRRGGFLDTVVEGTTGLFFEAPSPAQITRVLRQATEMQWDADAIVAHAEQFSEPRFIERLRALAATVGRSNRSADAHLATEGARV